MSETLVDEPPAARAGRRTGRGVYALVAVPPLAAVTAGLLAPDPHGHWTEHLTGAYLGGAQLVVLAVLAALIGRHVLGIPMTVVLGAVAVGIVLQVVANLEVAESIWKRPGDPGFGDGYEEGHDLAATGDLVVVLGGAAFAAVAALARKVPLRLAAVALLMCVVPPPWLWPGTGVLVLLLYGARSAGGFDRRPARSA